MARSGDDPPRRRAHACRVTTTSDLTTLEPKMVALYEAVLDEVEIRSGTQVLDMKPGGGLFMRLAGQRGARVTGTDAAASLPYPDDAFDVITSFDALQFAGDPTRPLREAGRVGRSGAAIVL